MKRKVNGKRVFWLFCTSCRCLRSKSWTKSLDQQNIVVKTRTRNCNEPFCNQEKEKKWKLRSASMTSNAMFRRQCSGASFCIFLWSNYQQLSRFYDLLLFSPCCRSSGSHCQVMYLFKGKESYKENFHSDNNWKTEWF